LKLNGTHELLIYADDVNVLGGSIHTIWRKAGALVFASKETGLEVMLIRLHVHVSISGCTTKSQYKD